MIWFLQIERDVQKSRRRRGKIAQCDWHMMTDSEEWRLLIWELSLPLPPCYYTMKRKKTDTSCCHLSESIKTIASIYVCLPLRRFFSLFIKHRSVFNNGSPPINSFFSWALQCTHRDCLIHSLKSEWLFSYLAQSISANVLHLNWSLYVWIVDQLAEEFFDSKTPSKELHSFWRAKSWVEAKAADFFKNWAPKF